MVTWRVLEIGSAKLKFFALGHCKKGIGKKTIFKEFDFFLGVHTGVFGDASGMIFLWKVTCYVGILGDRCLK